MDGGAQTLLGAIWRLIDLAEPETVELVQAMIAEICHTDPRATLDHDLRWFAGTGGRESALKIGLCSDGEAVFGYVPLRLAKSRISLHVGPVRLFSISVERLSLIGAPLFFRRGRSTGRGADERPVDRVGARVVAQRRVPRLWRPRRFGIVRHPEPTGRALARLSCRSSRRQLRAQPDPAAA